MAQGGGIRGGLYHSQSVEALLVHTPGLKVVAPATPYDAKGLLISAIRDDDPVVFLEHKRTYRLVRGETPEGAYTEPIGKAEVKRRGDDLTVVTYGMMLHYTLQAAAEVSEQDGIEAEVVDLRTLRPLDTELILESVRKTSKALIVQEDTPVVSVASEVAAVIADQAFLRARRAGTKDHPTGHTAYALQPLQEAEFMPSATDIAQAIRQLAAV